ncbi:MAG: T9SS type A sorting domain-containing protein [Bacteroidales bacterium]|nr:T9SS type A sorting domain-containing protein [Bacteroidales bacterium]
MKHYILILFISISNFYFAQQINIEDIQHNSRLQKSDLLQVSKSNPSSKHIERYLWSIQNRWDEQGKLIPTNVSIGNFIETNSKSLQTLGNWTPIGLQSWTNGSSGYNPGNGRINAVTVDPSQNNVVYVCSASGGLWKSNTGGHQWNTTTDVLPILGTSDVAVDPNNSDIIYLGTGDRDGLDTYGVGVYKSVDGGISWLPTGLFSNYDSEVLIVNAIEIDPQNSQVIYAGTGDGLYKSTDAGVNWTKVLVGKIMEVKVNPLNSNTVFANTKTMFYLSHDGGLSFSPISAGLNGIYSRFAFDISKTDTNYIYILAAGADNSFEGVYQSTDGGLSFVKKIGGNDINLLGYDINGSDDGSQAWYDLAIAVSPTSPETIYTGGVNVWKSTDGGSNFTIASHWYYLNNDDTYSHADIHSLDFYGNDLYCGSDGGVFKMVGESYWENLSEGLEISQIYKFSNSSDGSKISIGCQDNGTNISNNGDWTHVHGADGTSTLINPNNSNYVYLSYQYGAFRRSTTGGDNNTGMFNPSSYNEEGIWVTPFAMCKSAPQYLYIGLENIFRSDNNGSSWTSISEFDDGENFNVVAVAPSDPNYIYAAKNNHVYYTWDGGVNWHENTVPTLKPVVDIVVSDTDPQKVFFLKSSSYTKVYLSTNGGTSVSDLSGSIAQVSCSAIEYDNSSNNGIYVGSDFGVYYTNDNISGWEFFSNQLPTVKITDLEIVQNKIRAATYGRGVWESDLYEAFPDKINEISKYKFNCYPNPAQNLLLIENPSNDKITNIKLFSVSGQLIKAFEGSKNWIDLSDLVNGVYFLSIESNLNKEIHRVVKE